MPGLFFLVFCLNPAWQSLAAIDIPFFAGFYSDNHVSYYPDRDIREFDWDEKYRLCFGVDSLRWNNMEFNLKLNSQANFIHQQVLIDSLALSWVNGPYTLSGITRPYGIAYGYFFQQLYVSDPSHNSFLYDQTRFKGLEYGWQPSDMGFQAGLGGNVHNQAMGYVAVSGKNKDLIWMIRLDGKARDTHWTTANITPSVSCSYDADIISLHTDTAFKQVFAHEDRQSHQEFFHISETRLNMKNFPGIVICLDFSRREHAPRRRLGLKAALDLKISGFAIIPAYHYINVDDNDIHQLDCLASWNPRPQISFGVYTSYEYPQEDQSRITLGLQSSLRFDF
ncbi:MAG: hypothetical protein R6T89_06410 [Candidatus Syntrophosphaera sp.]